MDYSLDDNDINYYKIINDLYPKIEKSWVYTSNCMSCNVVFGYMFSKQHHCRCCGGSFCWNCCNNLIQIPSILNCPKENKKINKVLNYLKLNSITILNTKIVCNSCYSKIHILNNISNYINILYFCNLPDIYKYLSISKKFNLAAHFVIYQFKMIQYNTYLYNNWEKNIIRYNIKYYSEHSVWIKTFIKSYLESIYMEEKELTFNIDLLFKDKNIDCIKLHCSLNCKHELDTCDLIEIIDSILFYSDKYNKNICFFWTNILIKQIFEIMCNHINKQPILYGPLLKQLTKLFDIDICYIDDKIAKIIIDHIQDIGIYCNDLEFTKSTYILGYTNIIYLINKYYGNKINKNIFETQMNVNKIIYNMYVQNTTLFSNINLPYFFSNDDYIIEIQLIKQITNGKIYKMFLNNYKEKTIIIKKLNYEDEYYYYHLMFIFYEKMFYYFIKKNILLKKIEPYNIKLLNSQYIIIELPQSSILMSELLSHNCNIYDYVCKNESNKSLKKINDYFINSLAFMCAISHAFNINIINYENLFFENYCLIQLCGFEKKINNTSINICPNIYSIIGAKNSYTYNEFINILHNMIMIFNLNFNFLNSYNNSICNSININHTQFINIS